MYLYLFEPQSQQGLFFSRKRVYTVALQLSIFNHFLSVSVFLFLTNPLNVDYFQIFMWVVRIIIIFFK
jgi:hypothetical protein